MSRKKKSGRLGCATLFFAGDERLVVAPIPSTLEEASGSGTNGSRMQVKAKPWRLP
jgi:hypothetical protein